MYLFSFIFGFFVKTIASLDDTISNIPILLGITKTRSGKIAFSIGNLIAVFASISIAIWFAEVLQGIKWYRHIVAGLIYLLAIAVAFNFFAKKELKIGEKILKKKSIKAHRFIRLLLLGFIISILTLIDDTIVFIPALSGDYVSKIWASAGIILSTIIQLIVVIIFSEQLERFRYRKQIAVVGLFIVGTLFLLGWI